MLTAGSVVPTEPVSRASTREQLETLLREVNALSNRLKGVTPVSPGSVGLAAAARAVLRLLSRAGPMSVPNIARARGTSRQNIQVIVNRLKADGCVGLRPNPAHKRSELIFVTERGASLLERAGDPEAQCVDLLLPQVSDPELSSACQLLRRLREALLEGTHEAQPVPAARQKVTGRLKQVRTGDQLIVQAVAGENAPDLASDSELPVNLL